MKMTTLKSVAIAVGLASSAFGQATSPVVGYETITLQPNQFNFFGLRFAEKIEAAGQFEVGDATGLVDNDGSFTFVVPEDSYIFEFTGGSSVVVTGADISAAGEIGNLDGTGLAGIDYTVRRLATLTDVFGENNEAGLLAGSGVDTADVILLPQPDGTFNQVFRNAGLVVGGNVIVPPSWQDTSNNVVDPPLLFTDAILVQTQPRANNETISFTVAGSLITESQAYDLNGSDQFNFVSSVYPVGATLGSSGLESSVQAGAGVDTADVVFLPRANGTFDQFFFNAGLVIGGNVIVPPSWQNTSNGDATNEPLPSGYVILRRGGDATTLVTPPQVIADLN